MSLHRKADVRLPGNSHGARPVRQIIPMIKRTLAISLCLSWVVESTTRSAAREKPGQCTSPSKGRAPPSARRRGSLLLRPGRAPVKRLGLGVSEVDQTTTFDFDLQSSYVEDGAEQVQQGAHLCPSDIAYHRVSGLSNPGLFKKYTYVLSAYPNHLGPGSPYPNSGPTIRS